MALSSWNTLPASNGWGVSGEFGLAFRRDRTWFHPQLVIEGILPFAQDAPALGRPLVLFVGARFFL